MSKHLFRFVKQAASVAQKRCAVSPTAGSDPIGYEFHGWKHIALFRHLHRIKHREIVGSDAEVWEYSLTGRTRRELAKFLEYAHDQGIADREYEPGELFVTDPAGE